MGEPVGTLGIDFAISTGGAIAEFAKLGSVADKETAAIAASLNRVDIQVRGLGDTKAAIGRFNGLGDAAGQASVAAVREFARIERAGESMSSSLERQIAVFGKTTEEIRAMKVETLASNAAQKSQTELAERLRSQLETLVGLEAAAAIKIGEQAAATRDAAIAAQLFEARVREGAEVMRAEQAARDAAIASGARYAASLEQQAAVIGLNVGQLRQLEVAEQAASAEGAGLADVAARIRAAGATMAQAEQDAAAAATHNATALRDAAIAHQQFEARVREGVSAMEAEASAQANAAASATRFRAMIDPAAASQARFTAMIEEARSAIGPAGLSIEEFAQAEKMLTTQSEAATLALKRLGGQSGQARQSAMVLGQQFSDIGTSIAGGISPMVVFAQQSGQVAFALQGMEGAAGRVGAFLGNPWIAAITAALTVVAVFSSKLFESASAADVLAQHQKAMAEVIDQATGRVKEQSAALLLNQQIQTQGDLKDIQRQATRARAAIMDRAGASSADFATNTGSAGLIHATTPQDAQILAALNAFQASGNADKLASAMHAIGAANPALKSVTESIIGQGAAWTTLDRKAQQYQATLRLEAGQGKPGDQRTALGQFGPERVDSAMLDAQAKLAGAVTKTQKAEAEATITHLKLVKAHSEGLISDKDYVSQMAAADRATNSATEHVDKHAAALVRAHEAIDAQVKNLYALADAYSSSSGAALIAEATLKAQSQAIKSQDGQTAAINREISVAIAQRVADAAKATASMHDQADVQEQVNVFVEAGIVAQKDASETIRDHMALLPLLAAQQAAQQLGNQQEIARTTAAIEGMTAAQDRLRVAQTGPKAAPLSIDLGPIKKSLDDYVDGLNEVKIHAAQVAAEMSSWEGIAQRAQNAAGGMADAWGSVGKAIGDTTALLITHTAEQKRQADEYAKQLDDPKLDPVTRSALEIENARKSTSAQVQMYGDIADSAQGFFKKGTTGYKALGAAEKVFRLAELAMSIENAARQIGLIGGVAAVKVAATATSIGADTAETVASVANSGVRASADGVAAVAKTASSVPFPANLAAMAAVAAALATFGVMMVGGGGGGTAKAPASNQGTGTVFGDKDAQSESLAHSIDSLKAVDTLTMRYSAGMLASLQAIEQSVGGLTNSVIAAGNIGSNLGVSESKGGLLGTKKKIVASGLYAGSTSLEDALAGSFDIDYFADVSKKKFLGSAKIKTTFADAGDQLSDQFSLILQGFYSTVEASATPLGQSLDEVHSRLANFVVDIGRIDTTGLSGEDIQKKLAAVFSAEGDKIAEAAEPGFEKFQKAGEGYLETLTRVVTSVESVTSALDLLGESTKGVGADTSMAITGMFDSLSDFTDAANSYFDAYYTDAEKTAAKTAQLGKAFDMLGVAMPTSIASFRSLVDAQDLTTAAGQSTYATLLKLAPAFSDLNGTASDLAGTVSNANDVLSERQDIERQILEINGDTAAIRALDLAKINESNRALQEHAWALQDEKDAAAAAAQASQALASQRDSLNRQLLTAQGDTAALRALDLAAMDATLRPIQEHINALADQAAATQAAAAAAEAAAQKEAAVAQERAGIQNEIWQLQGNTAAIRATELAALDPTDRALKQQLYALQDQQAAAAAAQQAADAAQQAAEEAAQAADQLRQAWASIADGILDEVKRIRGLSDEAGPQSYASLLGQFNAATAAARAGDQDAAKSLPELSKSLLDIAAQVATSQQELNRVQGVTAASLEQTYNLINGTAMPAAPAAASTPKDSAWWNAYAASATAAAPLQAPANDAALEQKALRDEVAGLRADLRTALATIANSTGGTLKILKTAAGASEDGQALGVEVINVVETKAAA